MLFGEEKKHQASSKNGVCRVFIAENGGCVIYIQRIWVWKKNGHLAAKNIKRAY